MYFIFIDTGCTILYLILFSGIKENINNVKILMYIYIDTILISIIANKFLVLKEKKDARSISSLSVHDIDKYMRART